MKTGVAFVKGVGFGFAVQKGNSNFLTGVTSSPPAALTIATTRATLDSSVRATAATQEATAVTDQVLCACWWACRRVSNRALWLQTIKLKGTQKNVVSSFHTVNLFWCQDLCTLFISRTIKKICLSIEIQALDRTRQVNLPRDSDKNYHLMGAWVCKDDRSFCTVISDLLLFCRWLEQISERSLYWISIVANCFLSEIMREIWSLNLSKQD